MLSVLDDNLHILLGLNTLLMHFFLNFMITVFRRFTINFSVRRLVLGVDVDAFRRQRRRSRHAHVVAHAARWV